MKAETADLAYSSLLLNFTCRSRGGLPGAEGSQPVDIQIGTNPRKAAILLKFSGHFKRFPNKTFQIKLCPERNTLSPSAGNFFFFFEANKATKSHICFKQIPLHHSFSLEVFAFTVLIYVAMLQHTNASRRYSNKKPYKGLDFAKESLLIQIKLLNLIEFNSTGSFISDKS